MTRLLPLSLLLILAAAGEAYAQTSGNGTGFNVSWSALDPGNDWTWQMI